MATVSLRSLCKRYPGADHLAVDNVDLEIAHGEFMVLLGPSGCGKSTTLRMIAGLESISSGDLLIDDKRVNDVPGATPDQLRWTLQSSTFVERLERSQH